ncbi:MAG: hypothetical protein AAF629_23480 [Chloroflexota bacterium]
MSCQSNAQKNFRCAVTSGISTMTSQSAYTKAAVAVALGGATVYVGAKQKNRVKQTVDTVQTKQAEKRHQLADRVSPTTNKMIDGLQTMDRYGAGKFGKGLIVGVGQALRVTRRLEEAGVPMGPLVRIANGLGKLQNTAGNTLGDASRKDLVATVVQPRRTMMGLLNTQEAVNLWHSRLTPKLNNRDGLGIGEKMLSSTGILVKDDQTDTTWHRGTTTVRMPDGAKRTLTHMQSLSYPGQHYYFDRKLTHQETASIATGQNQPPDMAGYIGQVGSVEGLTTWGQAKHALLKTRIYYPSGESPGQRPTKRIGNMRPLREGSGRWMGRQVGRYIADHRTEIKETAQKLKGKRS